MGDDPSDMNDIRDTAPPAPVAAPRLFRAKSLGQALGIYLPATAAFRLMGLVRSVILAWLIPKSDFGLMLVALLVVNVLTPIGGLSLHDAVARYVPMFEARGAVRAYLRTVTPLVLVIAAIVAAVLLATADPVGVWLFRSLSGGPRTASPETTDVTEVVALARWVAAAVLAMAVYFFLLSVLKGLRMFLAMSLMEMAQAALFTAAAVSAALLGAKSARAVLICYTMAVLAISLVFAEAIRRRLRGWSEQQAAIGPHERLTRRMLGFSLWSMGAAVMYQVLQNYPTWYLNKIHGPDATAIFGGMRTLTQVSLLLSVAIAAVVATMVTRTWEAEGREAADRQFHVAFKCTGLLLLALSAALAAGKPVIVLLFPASFAPGRDVVQLLLLVFLLGSYLTLLSLHFNLIEKTRLLFLVWTVGVAGTVAFAAILIRPLAAAAGPGHLREQLIPAAWAGAAGMAVAMGVCLVLLRIERRPLDRGSWLVMLASLLLCLPWPATAAATAVLVLFARPLVFTREEMALLRARAAHIVARPSTA